MINFKRSNGKRKLDLGNVLELGNLSKVKFLIGCLMLFVLIFAFYIRHRLLPVITTDNLLSLLAFDADTCNYMRLFELAQKSFPKMPPRIDYYSNYPWGLVYFLPMVWPYFLVATSMPLSLIFSIEPLRAAGIISLLLSVLTIISIYFMASKVFDRKVGLLSAVFSAFLPSLVFVSEARIDHHVADIFLATTLFALYLVSIDKSRNGSRFQFVIITMISGFLVAFSMLVSLSMLLIISFIAFSAILSLYFVSRDDSKSMLISSACFYGFASMALLLMAIFTNWFSSTLSFNQLSYLHIVLLLLAAVFCIGLYLILQLKTPMFLLRLLLGSLFLVLALLIFYSPLNKPLITGFYRSIGSYPLAQETLELSPLFRTGLSKPFKLFTPFCVLLPLILSYLVYEDSNKKYFSAERSFFYTILIPLVFYTLQAQYYAPFLAPFISIIFACGIMLVSEKIVFCFQNLKFAQNNLRKMQEKAFLGFKIALAIVISIPLLISMVKLDREHKALFLDKNKLDLVKFIKNNTPYPGVFSKPDKKPKYSILCDWYLAYQMQYLANRATVSTGNTDIGANGIISSTIFFNTQDEKTALEIAKKVKAKYVVISPSFSIWEGDITKITSALANPSQTLQIIYPSNHLKLSDVSDCLCVKLFWQFLNPSLFRNTAPLHHFRLINASFRDSSSPPLFLFEIVKGTKIIVHTKPFSPVSIWTVVSIQNTNHKMEWREMGTANKDGIFSSIVPYSTRSYSYTYSKRSSDSIPLTSIAYADFYRIQIPYKTRKLFVDNDEIIKGSSLKVYMK